MLLSIAKKQNIFLLIDFHFIACQQLAPENTSKFSYECPFGTDVISLFEHETHCKKTSLCIVQQLSFRRSKIDDFTVLLNTATSRPTEYLRLQAM
jgi:hypothetical protein